MLVSRQPRRMAHRGRNPRLADREPDGTEVKSVLACDPDAIVCNSFSKFFGMTGWRLGWAILPDEPTVLEAVDDLATNYYLCAHTPTQHAALACFTPESLAGMRSSSSGNRLPVAAL